LQLENGYFLAFERSSFCLSQAHWLNQDHLFADNRKNVTQTHRFHKASKKLTSIYSFLNRATMLFAIVALLSGLDRAGRSAAERSAKKPNIIFIMADDLGYTDVACFGSKYYETPNIDRLATLRNFRWTVTSSPSN